MTNPTLKKNIEFENSFLQDKIERRAYEQREKAIRDYYSYMNSYKEEGREEGIQKEKIQNAINGLKKGYSLEIISDITNLSIQDIEKIKKEYL